MTAVILPTPPVDQNMLFRTLRATRTVSLENYSDIDQFHESERYAHAESIPLSVKNFNVSRASIVLPSCTLSLVRTFPRIVNGYDLSDRMLIVVPMSDVSSTRLNGKAVGQSLILLKGTTNCTVLEPESRLVAILSIRRETLDWKCLEFGDGHVLIHLRPAELSRLQMVIRGILELVATESDTVVVAEVLISIQATLFAAFEHAMRASMPDDCGSSKSLVRYKALVDQVDQILALKPLGAANERLADEIGVSVRTLQTASRSVCGLAAHRYSRLVRLWSVRRQLRTGVPGLTVKASALAHGFWHLSEFTNAYRQAFGELPSFTLAQAKILSGPPQVSSES